MPLAFLLRRPLQAACAEAEAAAAAAGAAGRGSVLEEVRDATRSLHSVLAGQRAREVALALQERNVPEDKWWGALTRVVQGNLSDLSLWGPDFSRCCHSPCVHCGAVLYRGVGMVYCTVPEDKWWGALARVVQGELSQLSLWGRDLARCCQSPCVHRGVLREDCVLLRRQYGLLVLMTF